MKRLLPFLLLAGSCTKNDGSIDASIIGSWRYTGNNKLVGENLGDSLRFVKPDAVYYTFQGSTTWSNFRLHFSRLQLIGSVDTVTLTIQTINSARLTLIINNPNLTDTASFQKFTP